ncbi:MAG: hypothetical protein ACRBCJ_00725 [Hyphomicrobiaceae bacterium]
MRLSAKLLIVTAIALAPGMWSASAHAACMNKAAKASAFSESQAKWFAMETIVQQVDWGIWPVWVASGKTPGYSIKKVRYECAPGGFGSECTARARICPAK